MRDQHLTPGQLEWYVTSGLESASRGFSSERLETMEEHVSACARCADALVREAELELTLAAAATHRAAPSGRVMAWVGAFAVAAGLLLFLSMPRAAGHDPAPNTNAPAVSVPMDAGVSAPEEHLALDARRY